MTIFRVASFILEKDDVERAGWIEKEEVRRGGEDRSKDPKVKDQPATRLSRCSHESKSERRHEADVD